MNPQGVELFCPRCRHQCPPGASHEPCKKCGYGADLVEDIENSEAITREMVEAGVFERDPSELTCTLCSDRDICDLVDDPYNTNGDCLMSK